MYIIEATQFYLMIVFNVYDISGNTLLENLHFAIIRDAG